MAGPGKPGPEPKLAPDARTLDIIRGAASRFATHEDIAGFLGVCEKTWHTSRLRHPEFDEAFQQGLAQGKISLRRAQFEAAVENKNPTMMIWLGKQYLDQKDRVENTHSGPDGGAIEVSNARSRLADLVSRIAGSGSARDSSGEPDRG